MAQVAWDWELILVLVVFSFLVGLGLWCILKVKRWGQRQETLTPQEELAGHQAMLEQGLLTQEEFERVRARLEARAAQAEVSPAAQAAKEETPPTTSAPPDAGRDQAS